MNQNKKPTWKVLCCTDMKYIDVLDTGYNDGLVAILKEHKRKNEKLYNDIKLWLHIFHWRSQFEFSMVGANGHRLSQIDIDEVKNGSKVVSPGIYVDVYEQVMTNFDNFVDYVWKYRKSIKEY